MRYASVVAMSLLALGLSQVSCGDDDDGGRAAAGGSGDGGSTSTGGSDETAGSTGDGGSRSSGGTGGGTGEAGGPSGGDTGTGGDAGSTSSGGSAGASTGPSLDELPNLVAEVVCDAVETCMGPLAEVFLGGGDCVTQLGAEFADGDFGLIAQAIEDGTVEYDPGSVQACLDSVEGLGCDIMGGWYSEACEEAISGTVEAGGDCTIDDECVGDLICQIGAACPGTCSPRGSEGDGCDDDDQCQVGLVCASGLGTCVTPVAEGQDCYEDTQPCALPLMCVGEDQEADPPTAGTCTAIADIFAVAEGEECSLPETRLCQQGLFCALETLTATDMTMTCTADQAEPGGSCFFAIPDQCPAGEYCDADITAGENAGSCQTLPEAGQDCAPALFSGTGCQPYQACVDGTCRELQRLQGSCTADEECYSGNCDGGSCALPDPCG